MSLLISGSAAYDLLLDTEDSFTDSIKPDALDTLSASFLAPHLTRHFGGTGANIAWYSSLFIETTLVTSVGHDGDAMIEMLSARGIHVSHIEKVDGAFTATAMLGTDSGSRQIGFFHPGADALGSFPEMDLSSVSWAISSPRDEIAMLGCMRACSSAGTSVLFDPGQRISSMSVDDLMLGIELSSGVIANTYEWSVIAERLNLSIEEVLQKTDILVVTKGADGADIHHREGVVSIASAKPDGVVNPTGAGDAFRAGFLYGLTQEWDLEKCGQLGAVLGSFAVEIGGTQHPSLSLDQVWERVERDFGWRE